MGDELHIRGHGMEDGRTACECGKSFPNHTALADHLSKARRRTNQPGDTQQTEDRIRNGRLTGQTFGDGSHGM